jgi:hypothetical protein
VLLLLPLRFGRGLLHHGVVVGCGYSTIFLYCVYVNYCLATLQSNEPKIESAMVEKVISFKSMP